MERCCEQAPMVHADHVNSWWGVELLIPLLNILNTIIFVNCPSVDQWGVDLTAHQLWALMSAHFLRSFFGDWYLQRFLSVGSI
jgi:hypothetical protein